MDFYHTPTSCSQATHILLREAGLDFQPHEVDIFEHKLEDGSDYMRVNPSGYLPALILDDGMLLTENVAILDWICTQADDLLPTGRLGRTRHLQLLGFISSELHKPCIPLFFIEDADQQASIRKLLTRRFNEIGARLAGGHLFGDGFTGADAFLYVTPLGRDAWERDAKDLRSLHPSRRAETLGAGRSRRRGGVGAAGRHGRLCLILSRRWRAIAVRQGRPEELFL